MSWISSNATNKQNSKNDLSFYHGFSKTPVEPNSSGNAVTTLGNASTKGGHTVIGSEVWAEEIPWFGLVPSRAVAVTRLSGLTKLNDLVKVDGEGGKVYKYIGADDAVFTEAQWSSFWQEVTLTNGMELLNRHKQPVLRYYLSQPMQTLTTTNNASIDSKGYATRLFVNESDHKGQTSGGSVVSQFAAGTDNIKNGIPSVELNPKLYYNTTEKIAGTHYYDYNVSGTILWNENVASRGVKISCFRYIGKTVTGQLSTVDTTVKSHTIDIDNIKLALGMNTDPDSPTTSVTARVETVEDVVRTLLGLGDSDAIAATESIAATAANAVSTSLAGTADGTIGKAIADAKQEALDAINAVQHFSVVVVPDGQTIENVNPLVENTIYLVKDAKAAEGTYIEYIAYKPAGSATVTYEKIGSTAIDLSGYTTDAEHTALANRVTALDAATTGRVAVVEGKVTTLQGQVATITSTDATKEGSIAKALADAKKYAEEQAAGAKVALTAGTGITIPNSGIEAKAFTVSVDTEVIATKQSVDDLSTTVDDLSGLVTGVSQTVANIQSELSTGGSVATAIAEAKSAADAAQATADAKVASVTGPKSGLVTVTGDKEVTITVSGTIATKTDINTAITTSLNGTAAGTIGAAVADAKKAGTDAASALNTTKGQSLAQTGTLAGMFTVKTAGTVGTGITGITITDAGLATAISTAKQAGTDAQTAADAKVADVTVDGASIVTGNAGAKTAALTTTKGVAITPSADSTSTALATEASVAKALASITSVGVSYQVLGENEKHTSVATPVNGRIYLEKDTTNAEAGVYIEWMWTGSSWEQIGSTKTDHSSYASTITVNGSPKTVSNSAVDLGAFASSVVAGNGIASGSVSATGALSLVLTTASTTTAGIAQLTDAYTSTDATKAATGKSIAAAIATLDATKSVNGITVTQVDGKITELTETLIAASVPAGTTSVVGNVAYVGSTKHVIAPEKFETAAQMPATLTSWVADLSNLTVGDNMFKGCTGLTVFVGDLSSLTSGVDMFNGCALDEDSLEILSENLPKVSGGTIDIGASAKATPEMIATIKGKGWTVKSNGTAL